MISCFMQDWFWVSLSSFYNECIIKPKKCLGTCFELILTFYFPSQSHISIPDIPFSIFSNYSCCLMLIFCSHKTT